MDRGGSWIVLLGMALGTVACHTEDISCTTDAVYGLAITVQADGVASCTANVTVRDGDYEEVFPVTSDAQCIYWAALEREGTYAITVTQPGFAATSTTAVVPRDDSGCHAVTQYPTIVLAADDGGS